MDHSEFDPYWKLRPKSATPQEEICDCWHVPLLILVHRLGSNPLHCAECRGEVPPERLDLDLDLAERIASWVLVYGALYDLWLDSGEYEAWAGSRLYDPRGQVNRVGREIVAQLGENVPTFYWWFSDVEVDDCQPHGRCPACQGRLEPYEDDDTQVCHHCRILI